MVVRRQFFCHGTGPYTRLRAQSGYRRGTGEERIRDCDGGQVISEELSLEPGQATLVTMHGSELSRGGGGCRCMTMPLNRNPVNW